jgi:peroxiredoxin
MKSNSIWLVVVVIAAGLAVAACGDSGDSADTATEETTATALPETTTTTEATTTTAEVTTTTTEPPVAGEAQALGDDLETMNEAVGLPAPTIEGYDYLSANLVNWGADGPAAVLFAPLGDWCPHCSEHLDQLTDYLAENDRTGTAQVLLVTSEEQPSDQHPQNDWLTSQGWPFAAVLDHVDGSISQAFGITSVPTWILVGSDGTVVEVIDGHHVTPSEVFVRIDALE